MVSKVALCCKQPTTWEFFAIEISLGAKWVQLLFVNVAIFRLAGGSEEGRASRSPAHE